MSNDRDLRDCFAELRREDQAHAVEFSSLLHRAHGQHPAHSGPRPRANPIRPSVWVAFAAGLAVTIAVVVMWMPRLRRPTIASREISITEWKSPTSFLLRTPGFELLRTIPRIGEWPAASTGSKGGRRKSPPTRKKSPLKTSFKENLS